MITESWSNCPQLKKVHRSRNPLVRFLSALPVSITISPQHATSSSLSRTRFLLYRSVTKTIATNQRAVFIQKQLTAIASSNLNATRRESGTRVYTRTKQSMSTTKPINPWNSNGVRHFRTVPTNKGIKSNKNTQSQRSAQFSSHRKQVNQRESLSYFFYVARFSSSFRPSESDDDGNRVRERKKNLSATQAARSIVNNRYNQLNHRWQGENENSEVIPALVFVIYRK